MRLKFYPLQAEFVWEYGSTLTVREYFQAKRHLVEVLELNSVAPEAAKFLASVSPRNGFS